VNVFLETERMVLRRFTGEDAGLLFELDGDPEVMRWLSGGSPTPIEVIHEEILPRFVGAYGRYDGLGYWVAIERGGGEFLGWFALHQVDDRSQDEAEVGYRLRRACWAQGYATEGVLALLRKGFEDHGLRLVFGTTYEHNAGSRRVMEKAGMRLVRRFRLDPSQSSGTFQSTGEAWDGDDVEYAITREEWVGSAGRGLGGVR
jgi:RimJ/RimL family protein N-acetyltransferase